MVVGGNQCEALDRLRSGPSYQQNRPCRVDGNASLNSEDTTHHSDAISSLTVHRPFIQARTKRAIISEEYDY
jgi:hypothetical protein